MRENFSSRHLLFLFVRNDVLAHWELASILKCVWKSVILYKFHIGTSAVDLAFSLIVMLCKTNEQIEPNQAQKAINLTKLMIRYYTLQYCRRRRFVYKTHSAFTCIISPPSIFDYIENSIFEHGCLFVDIESN